MPDFLEKKLRNEYGDNDRAIYGTMNNLGAMHGNKITPRGRAMERKHASKQIPRAAGGIVSIPNWQSLDEPDPEISPLERAALLAKQQQEQQQAQQPAPALTPQPPAPQAQPQPDPALDQNPDDQGSVDDAPGASATVDPSAIPPATNSATNSASSPAPIIPPAKPSKPSPPMEQEASSLSDQNPPAMPPGWKPNNESIPKSGPGPIGSGSGQEFTDRAGRFLLDDSFQRDKSGQLTDKPKGIPIWRQAVSAAIPRLGPMLMHSPNKVDQNLPAAEKVAGLQEKSQAAAGSQAVRLQQIEESKAAREGHLDTLVTNADTRRLNAQTAAEHVKAIQDGAVRKWVEDKIGKSRAPDATYQGEHDPRPSGYEFVPNPQAPGEGWAVPPAWLPMPPELVSHAPGYTANQLAPHSVVQRAMADYNKLMLEKQKPQSQGTSEFSTAYLTDPKFKRLDGTVDVEAARKQYNADLSARTLAGRPPASTTPKDNQVQRSYEFHTKEIDAVGKPISEGLGRIGRLQDTIDQGNMQSDALVAPELLSVMAGGTGSGLRMNEAEIARIVGGRTQLESLKAFLNKWKLDPAAARSITPEQDRQVRALVKTVGDKLAAKQQVLTGARQALSLSQDPMEHRKILYEANEKLNQIDQGKAQAGNNSAPVAGGMLNGKKILSVKRIE